MSTDSRGLGSLLPKYVCLSQVVVDLRDNGCIVDNFGQFCCKYPGSNGTSDANERLDECECQTTVVARVRIVFTLNPRTFAELTPAYSN